MRSVAAVVTGAASADWKRKREGQAPRDFLDEIYGPRRDLLLDVFDWVVMSVVAAGENRNPAEAELARELMGTLAAGSKILKDLHSVDVHNVNSPPPIAEHLLRAEVKVSKYDELVAEVISLAAGNSDSARDTTANI